MQQYQDQTHRCVESSTTVHSPEQSDAKEILLSVA